MEDQRHVHRVRPYQWGAIYLSDADCQEDFDIDFEDGAGPVWSTAAHVAVVVVNARAVEEGAGDVTLDLWVEDHQAGRLPYQVVLEVPSGRLFVGDADIADEVALQPGRWLLQFAVDHPQDARQVDIVVSPL